MLDTYYVSNLSMWIQISWKHAHESLSHLSLSVKNPTTMEYSFASLLLLWGVCTVSGITAYYLTDENNLQTALMSGYKTNLRPGANRSVPLEVFTSFHLFFVKEFEEYSGKFTVNGVFYTEWYDERLKWDNNSYNGLEKTTFFQTELWLPNFININPFNKIFGLGSDLMTIDVFSTGLCVWIPYQSFEVICDADVTKYPFDTQFCTLNFFVWGHKNDSVKINITDSQVGFALYKEHGLWDITKTRTYTRTSAYGHDEIIVGLWLKRRSAFYMASFIIPMFSIGMLMGFVFFSTSRSWRTSWFHHDCAVELYCVFDHRSKQTSRVFRTERIGDKLHTRRVRFEWDPDHCYGHS